MEFFDLIIIVPVREVLLLEILLELFPHNISFINLLHLLEVFPPYGWTSSQIEDGYSSLHISWIVLGLEFFSHPKKSSFSFLSILYLTIKCRRHCILKFIMWTVPLMHIPLIPVRWRAWTPSGSFRVRWSTGRPFSSFATTLYLPLDVFQTLQQGCI